MGIFIMNKLPILVDQDGVLVDFVGGIQDKFLEFKNDSIISETEYSQISNLRNINTYYVADGIENPKLNALSNFITEQPNFFLNLKPYPNIKHWMNELRRLAKKDGREVFICTKPLLNNPTCCSDKINWVEIHLGKEWKSQVIKTSDKTLINGCILLDDHPDPIGIMKPSWQQILMDQPYNKNINKRRIYDWSLSSVNFLIDSYFYLP